MLGNGFWRFGYLMPAERERRASGLIFHARGPWSGVIPAEPLHLPRLSVRNNDMKQLRAKSSVKDA